MGSWDAGIPPSATFAHQLGANDGGEGGVDMFAGHDRALTSKGDNDHGWSGCSATGPGQS
jgi:hypothetical protein